MQQSVSKFTYQPSKKRKIHSLKVNSCESLKEFRSTNKMCLHKIIIKINIDSYDKYN